jgi:putative nucleotidyltransferase with HDIG domain
VYGSALIAMGFLPLFESWTKITTDQTLLELADLNRPLLKRLSLEASGTYAHSINVANLAEAAARAIDANPLLVRVGAYYHDVGKIVMPQYFIENQARGRNPHDHLDPRKSAQIVGPRRRGLKLAEQAKLPPSVRASSRTPRHADHRLLLRPGPAEVSRGADLDPADFAYGGPKPQTRETAILMLADSVESASKVLQDPTPERIRGARRPHCRRQDRAGPARRRAHSHARPHAHQGAVRVGADGHVPPSHRLSRTRADAPRHRRAGAAAGRPWRLMPHAVVSVAVGCRSPDAAGRRRSS